MSLSRQIENIYKAVLKETFLSAYNVERRSKPMYNKENTVIYGLIGSLGAKTILITYFSVILWTVLLWFIATSGRVNDSCNQGSCHKIEQLPKELTTLSGKHVNWSELIVIRNSQM